jgi:membrane-bound lytic murein transglycosylase F
VQNVAMPKFPSLMRLPRHALLIGALALLLTLYACHHAEQSALADWQNGELVVLEDAQPLSADVQFNHELAVLFADYLHVKLAVVPVDVADAQSMLAQHRAHLAAIGWRSNTAVSGLVFAPSYQTIAEQLVFNDDLDTPKNIADILKLRIAVVAGSAQEAVLEELKRSNPSLHWESRREVGIGNLLDEVAEGILDVTLANQQQFSLAKNFHNNLNTARFVIAAPSQLAWAFATDSDIKLREQAAQFFSDIRKDGRLPRLIDRFYGFNQRLAPLDSATFLEQIDKTLPRYRKLFEEAAHWSGLEWQLIAALAYQESHWNPRATSPTNVRGMMMLTEDTADQLHVENRLDARQSTLAGAHYLATIRDQLPLRITEPDRTWMALAAYNQGYGHLEDARVLTQRMGMNADRWVDVKKWMPKLTQERHFSGLKHGYARGGEAVILVENIRMYYDMLKRAEGEKSPADLPVMPYYQLLESGKKLRIKNFSNS